MKWLDTSLYFLLCENSFSELFRNLQFHQLERLMYYRFLAEDGKNLCNGDFVCVCVCDADCKHSTVSPEG